MIASVTIGMDLGGTNLKGAVVDQSASILAKRVTPTRGDRGSDTVIEDMVAMVHALLAEASLPRRALKGVGVGAPGPLRQRTGRIIRSPNLPGWVNVPLRDRLHDELNVPVTLDNDGNAAAFGEYWAAMDRETDDLVMLTLGTGVGGGVVLQGRLLHGYFENAAELGHWIVVADGLPCSCGQRGCLEQYASANGLVRRVLGSIRQGESCALADAATAGQPITAEQVVDAARADDSLCLHLWNEACRYVALACINIQHAYNPARIVLGGGMSRAGDFLLDRVTDHVSRECWSLHHDFPKVSLAKLGYDAGVIGAAGLAWQQSGYDLAKE